MALRRPYPDEKSRLAHEASILGLEAQARLEERSQAIKPNAKISNAIENVRHAFDGCHSGNPCRIPRCTRCSTRLARQMRCRLQDVLANAVYHRRRYYLPVTFTRRDWITDNPQCVREIEGVLDSLVEHFEESTLCTGGWFAIDVVRGRFAKADDLNSVVYNYHVHGVITATEKKAALDQVNNFCDQHGVRLMSKHKNYLSPRDSSKVAKWVKKEELCKWIKYADKISTQRLATLVDDVMVQVQLNGATRHVSFGELQTNVTGRVVQRRCQELCHELESVPHKWLPEEERQIAIDCLVGLGTMYGTPENLMREYEVDRSSIGELLHEQQRPLGLVFLDLARRAMNQLDDRTNLRLGGLDQNGVVSYLVAGREILRLRQNRRLSDWEQIVELGNFWPSALKDETAEHRSTYKWREHFYKCFAADQLRHIVDMRQAAQYWRWNLKQESLAGTA